MRLGWFFIAALALGSPPPKTRETPDPDSFQLPEPLTQANFDEVTSERLTFVEFFSPYCIHCKQLAPTWRATYKQFEEQMKKLNVDMRQVDCVESGDLCDREDVSSYPMLRMYAPVKDKETGKPIPKKSKIVEHYPRSLKRTEKHFMNFMRNAVFEYDTGVTDMPSSSVLMTVDELLPLVTGEHENDQPTFVSFYSATDEQFKNTDNTGKNHFGSQCLDCFEFKHSWDKLSNHILTTVKTAHVNCLSNPVVCEKLGLKQLTNERTRTSPRAVMFLPKVAKLNKVDYKGEHTVEAMKDWAIRTYENSQYEVLNAKGLLDVMAFYKELPKEPLEVDPSNPQVSIVFYFDQETDVEEDRAILPHILEQITDSPFNVHLYTAKHAKIAVNLKTQEENLVNFINYDSSATKKEFNEQLYIARTISTKPYLFISKDNALFAPVFQSFAPEDIRSASKVYDFIEENQFPLYHELTPKLLKTYFTKSNKYNDRVVVAFFDSKSADNANNFYHSLSLAAHEYHHFHQDYHYNKILEQRQDKANVVQKLQDKDANTNDIIQALRKEVPHGFQNDKVLFTFIDLANHPNLVSALGWSGDFKAGDAVVVSRDNKYMWDTNINGDKLTSDPRQIRDVLRKLLDPTLVAASVPRKPVSSPYPLWLPLMNNVHQYGILGYLGFFTGLYGISYMIRNIRKRRRSTSSARGILDSPPKKD